MRYLFLFLLLPTAYLAGQCDDRGELDRLALAAYLTNDAGQWATVLRKIEALPAGPDKDLRLAKTLLGATGTALSEQNEDEVERLVDAMEAPLDRLLEADKNHPAANGLYSAYLGLLIAQTPIKGMFYGSKSSRLAKKGVSKNDQDPVAQHCLGSNLHYTPTTWGGDPAAAVEHLQKSVDLYPASAAGCDWFQLQTYALLGQAQVKAGDKAGARRTYLTALKIRPDFRYVSKILLPALDGAR